MVTFNKKKNPKYRVTNTFHAHLISDYSLFSLCFIPTYVFSWVTDLCVLQWEEGHINS